MHVCLYPEELRDASITVCTVLGCLHTTHVVTTTTDQQPDSVEFDVGLINCGDLPVPDEWKARLHQKVSEGANKLSLYELDVGQMSNHSVNAPVL